MAHKKSKLSEADSRPQCAAVVYRRDTYRRTGRGPTGFEMHYTRCRCRRTAVQGADLCWQHEKRELEDWGPVLRVETLS